MRRANLLASLIMLTVLLGTLVHVALTKDYYDRYLEKHGSYTRFESREIVDTTIDGLISYLRGADAAPPIIFTANERSHLRDVRRLLDAARAIIVFSLYYLSFEFLFRDAKNELPAILRKSGAYTGIGALVCGISALLFSQAFELMHLILFPQGNWQFVESSVLIRLFPEGFFFDLFLLMIIYITILASALFILGKRLK